MTSRRWILATVGSVSMLSGCSRNPFGDSWSPPCELAAAIVEKLLRNDVSGVLDYHPYPYQEGIDEATARERVGAILITEIYERNGSTDLECGCDAEIPTDSDTYDALAADLSEASLEKAQEVRVDLSLPDGMDPDDFSVYVVVLETDEGQFAYPVSMSPPYGFC